MSLNIRTLFFISLGLTVVAILLLASGITNVKFQSGQPFFLRRDQQPAEIDQVPFKLWNLAGLWRIAGVIILWFLIPLSIFYFIISPEIRKQAIKRFITATITIYAMLIIIRQLATTGCTSISTISTTTIDTLSNDIEAEFTPNPSQPLTFFASFMIIALLVMVIGYLWRRYQSPGPTLEKLAQEAKEAIIDIQAGADIENTIIRCYIEMNNIVLIEKGIKRKDIMTPREFEIEIKKVGIPSNYIQRLTRLFEDVRYGGKTLGEKEDQEAIACLSGIVDSFEKDK